MSDSNKDPDDRARPPRSDDSRPRGGQPSGQRGSGSSAGRKEYGQRDAKRSYRDRDDRKPYGDRKSFHDDKPRTSGDRDRRKPYGDRDQKRPYGDRDARKPYGDRDQKRPYGDRDARKPYGDREQKRSYGDRDSRRPYGDRDQKRSYGDRDARKPYGDRDQKRPYGDRDARKPYGDRDQKRSYGDRDDRRGGERRDAPAGQAHERHGAADLAVRARHDDPMLPDSIEARQLDKAARAELKTLSKENADWVARHLVAASEYLDQDPPLAHRHAMSAARRAGRIAVVRETLAITAYATGDFALALRELRTYRRISGSNDQLPLMVDSERGVGRPDRALEVGRAVDRSELPASVQVGLAIAMSGARLDLEQPELALAELEIPQLDPERAFSYSPALFSAYAEVLDELGRAAEAERWRVLAARADAALAGPAEAELIEIFDLEPDDAEDHAETPVVVSVDEAELGDPGDVLEDDVRAVLAEADDLDAEATSDASEDTADGAVPHED